jgi:uncharacterized protein YjbI with pentapeptide repeats
MTQTDIDNLISDHEKWFKNHSVGAKLILKGENISGISFKSRNLHQSEFSGIRFKDCDFTGSQMYRLNMSTCTYEDCIMNEAALDDSLISDLSITGSSLEKASFDGIIGKSIKCRKNSMKSSTWIKSSITDFTLEDCDLSRSSFRRSYLRECKMKSCSITESDFTRSKLLDSELVAVIVTKAIFDESSLDGFRYVGYRVHRHPTRMLNTKGSILSIQTVSRIFKFRAHGGK